MTPRSSTSRLPDPGAPSLPRPLSLVFLPLLLQTLSASPLHHSVHLEPNSVRFPHSERTTLNRVGDFVAKVRHQGRDVLGVLLEAEEGLGDIRTVLGPLIGELRPPPSPAPLARSNDATAASSLAARFLRSPLAASTLLNPSAPATVGTKGARAAKEEEDAPCVAARHRRIFRHRCRRPRLRWGGAASRIPPPARPRTDRK
ncbi:hypothetical protein ACHAWF_013209 [Thalassiosira exigua]